MEVKVDADNWKVICTVQCPAPDPAALRAALEEHLQIGNKLPEFLKLQAKAERYGLIAIEVQFLKKRMKEDDFFALVLAHSDLHGMAEQYVRAIIAHIRKTRRPLWAEEDRPLGLFVACRLALLVPGHVDLYAELLEVSDMDHEVYQEDQIALLLKTHGLNPQTLRLLAIRATVAAGQVGEQQIDCFRSSLAKLFSAQPVLLDVFLSAGLNALLARNANQKPPVGSDRKEFYLVQLKPLLTFIADPARARAWRELVKEEVRKKYKVIDDEKPAE